MGIQISSLTSIDNVQSSDYFVVGRPGVTAYKASPAQVSAFVVGLANTWTQNQIFSSGLKFTGSSPISGYVLTSDSAGNASWAPQAGIGGTYTADETTLHLAGTVFSLLLASPAKGGTGLTTLTSHGVMIGQGTSNVGFATIGTAGRVLIDQGSGADPAFTVISGDGTLAGSGALTIGSSKITYAKIQNLTNATILGNNSGGAAAPSEITLGGSLAFSSSTLNINLGNSNTWTANQIFAATVFNPNSTQASSASLGWNGVSVSSSTLTLTGSTNVTTSTGVNLVNVTAPTITSSSSLTVTNASTMSILGAPSAGGSTTITNAYALWIQAGKVRLDGTFQMTSGTTTNGYVLTCDSSGNGTWQASSGGGGTVSSVANSDSSITVSPNTGAVIVTLNVANANNWTNTQTFQPTKTLASGSSLTWDGFSVLGTTLTLTGTTGVTTSTGLNLFNISAPTITDSSSVTVTNSATLAIKGAPTAGGSVTITNKYALWVQAGKVRFDGAFQLSTSPTNNYVLTCDASGNGTWQAASGGGSGTVTSVATDSTLTGGAITTTGTLGLNLANANTWTALQTLKISDTATNTVVNCLVLTHDSSGTIAGSFGTGIKFQGQDSTTADVDMVAINSIWSVATHASRSSQIQFQTVAGAGSLSTGLIVGSGIASATGGITIGGSTSSIGGVWASGVTPSTVNGGLYLSSSTTNLNANSGGTVTLSILPSNPIVTVTGTSIACINPISVTENISNVSTDGLLLTNVTSAGSGSQQYSPRLHFEGQGWKIGGTPASQPVDWIIECQPVQGSSNPSSNLVFRGSVNSGSYLTAMQAQSNGLVSFPVGVLGGAATTQGNNDTFTGSLQDATSGSVIFRATNATAGGSGVIASQFTTLSNGGSQQSYAYAGHYEVTSTGSGGINNARGLNVAITNTSGGGTIVTLRGISIDAPSLSAGGAVTTYYGIYIEGLKTGGAGTGWGIYQSDTADKNYFAGPSAINTSTFGTVNKLTVNPNLTTDNNAQVQLNNVTTASKKVLVLQGIASQTGNLLEAQDSSGNPLGRITGDGWLVNAPGAVRVTGDATNATNTMSNLSDLTINVVTGVKYLGVLTIIADNSTAAEGLKFDFNGGSASVSSISFGFATTPAGTVTFGTVVSTALGTPITVTLATTGDLIYMINYAFVCNGSGTFIPRFAENSAHSTGTATIRANSFHRADVSAN